VQALIPIQNIYFLLCYAWDCLEEGDIVHVEQDECQTYADLFARVLVRGVSRLLKRGLDRGYLTEEEDTTSLRGKFDVSTTIKHNCLQHARVHCLYDSLSYDVVHNRIVKTTLGTLARCEGLDGGLRDRLLSLYRRLHEVTAIDLLPGVFGKVVLHRNNAFYRFLVHVCHLVYDCLLPDKRTGRMRFADFMRDEKRMRELFERFVFNFYRLEQDALEVKRERIDWQCVDATEGHRRFLPTMRTDVSLVSSNRHIVLDTKFTIRTLQWFHGRETVKSNDLYQMFAYLKNLQVLEACDCQVEGVLLYPTVATTLDLEYRIHGHRLRVATLDLNTHWSQIAKRLLGLLKDGESE